MPVIRVTVLRGSERGITLIELLISLLLASIVAGGALHFYKAQNRVYLSQTAIADRQGNLRSAMDELTRQVRQAGYLVPGGPDLRSSTNFDTLEIYIGRAGGAIVDTLRYFVQAASGTKILVKQVNRTVPQVFAESIDTALFVPVGAAPSRRLAVALVSSVPHQFAGTALAKPRRLATTVNMRNR